MTDVLHLDPEEPPLPSYWPVVWAALAVALALTLTLTGWAMTARLDAALVSHGVLHADSERKTVEHLEGGILAGLLVQSGDMVEAGQVVARLDPTQTDEKLAQLRSDRDATRFALWRLGAEEEDRPLDPATAPPCDTCIRADKIAETTRLFEARQRAHGAQIDSLNRQIAQLEGQIAANEGQRKAAERQVQLWEDERRMVADLVDRGASPKRDLLDLDRAIASLAGDRDESAGLVEAARQDIARARSDLVALTQQRLAEIATSETEARTRLAALDSQIRAMEDVRARLDLRAPQAGKVVEINTVTPGAVLGSGQPLMEILPRDDQLVALVKLPPDAIDTLHRGVPAKVRLTAFKRSDAPTVTGAVSYVSADLLEDPQTGASYFEARVTLDPDSVTELDGVALTAGMPVEVTLTIGERRAGDYLLEPILRHFRRAFNEE
ncbi:hypothetical protein BV509_18485 [Rhodovulum sulfidophilum]|uniref:Membrane fusion protein (MFP) family protein n=1 Tax=Rhodovulum visakhapatnamense TaxID=364297 RepID=A0ABS1RK77_9RHOB|nr:HlyD family type I secretion periplasmic adaptor subunit [Rhodovulum visakhapatnamense]MBL3570285.1 HlyD family type I secretion periplasmic adaptor subunit [Rhodovulum visakhapatnamense]MBL3580058.1 HlyD family type I secretion periplasmic adaptor subunit [Rhodovulum visakhapatnamense]OLS46143.1 hypothetical protein BV509_18485 [Rhodovulum sulfidophilum]